jgi:hypothetical protein
VLVAWKPFAANSATAAAITCSRRSSELVRAAGLMAGFGVMDHLIG